MKKNEILDREIIKKEILKKNEWLNGMADYRDGDLCSLNNEPEFFKTLTESKDLNEVWDILNKYDYAFIKWRSIVFAQSYKYGTFVYFVDTDKIRQIEHFTIPAFKKEDFIRDVNELNKFGGWKNEL